MTKGTWAVALAALALAPAAAQAFCPSYTASSAYNTGNCAVEAAPGQNPSLAQWQDIFEKVSRGPAAWGTEGPAVGTIGQGCGKPEPTVQVAPRFPCELLRAIAFRESSWRQFCVPDRPADQVGGPSRTIIAFDCGYGVGQVTSGMRVGENPSFDRARVAAEPVYNLATGTQILAAKWKATQCVGDNQPAIIEHWYNATWAYNGLAYINNPNNPAYASDRGVYNPAVGGGAPYQEKVWGAVQFPPSQGHWSSVGLAYPDPGEIGGGSSPPALTEPFCATPTDCLAARIVHRSACFPLEPVDGGSPDAGSPQDAGHPQDAGEPLDAGEPVDAGAAQDAGEPGDAGEKVDAGGAEDAGPKPDGGAAQPGGVDGGGAALGQVSGQLGCSAGPGESFPWWLAALGGAVLLSRRGRIAALPLLFLLIGCSSGFESRALGVRWEPPSSFRLESEEPGPLPTARFSSGVVLRRVPGEAPVGPPGALLAEVAERAQLELPENILSHRSGSLPAGKVERMELGGERHKTLLYVVRGEQDFLVLTLTAPRAGYGRLENQFERSLASLRFR